MERIKLFTAALLLAAISAGNDVWALSDSRKKDTRPVESPQFFSGNANPLLDFIFVADPTSVEYNGRLYVYGTNDTQQLDSVGKYGKNTYQYIPFTGHVNPEKPDVPLNKNDAFQKVQKRRVQKKR